MRKGKGKSFMEMLHVHSILSELFQLHQETLLDADIPLALKRLGEFEAALRSHIKDEEEVLLPVFERAGKVEGCTAEILKFEHKRMLRFVSTFRKMLKRVKKGNKRDMIRLLDMQSEFKRLVDHHDLRERNALYPVLDKVTKNSERALLLEKCRK